VVGCQESDQVSDVGGISGSAKGDATDGFDDLCACVIDADVKCCGVTLAELATAMGAAKSSVQELTNGLLARGYLLEEDRRFHLGPGPFILAARANKLAALSLNHESSPS